MVKRSSLYVIAEASGQQSKIGISANPSKRLRELQTGHPFPLQIHYSEETDETRARIIERFIHDSVGYLRTRGEWFDMSPDEAITEVRFAMMRWESNPHLEVISRYRLSRRG